jgi:hypothetical protein
VVIGAKASVITSSERTRGESDYAERRRRTGLDPGCRESASSGRLLVARRTGGRGTGAVKATGSYEGSLSVEGISDRLLPGSFTRGWSRRSRRSLPEGLAS